MRAIRSKHAHIRPEILQGAVSSSNERLLDHVAARIRNNKYGSKPQRMSIGKG